MAVAELGLLMRSLYCVCLRLKTPLTRNHPVDTHKQNNLPATAEEGTEARVRKMTKRRGQTKTQKQNTTLQGNAQRNVLLGDEGGLGLAVTSRSANRKQSGLVTSTTAIG